MIVREAFLLPTIPIRSCYTVNASFIVSYAPSFVNLGMIFLLRGRAVTSHVIKFLSTFIRLLITL
jgi:hypothetical protein